MSNRFLLREITSITLSILNIVKHCLHVWPGTLFIKLSAAGVHTVHGSEVLAAHPSSPDPFKHLRILTTVVTSFFVETITCRNISSTYPFHLIGLENILQCLSAVPAVSIYLAGYLKLHVEDFLSHKIV